MINQMFMNKNILLFLFIPVIGLSQGKLNQAKQNLTTKSSTSVRTVTNATTGGSNFSSRSGNIFVDIAFILGFEAMFGNVEARHFTPYPYYYDNVNGLYDYGAIDGDQRSYLSANANYFASSSIQGIDARVNYRFLPLLGLELSHNSLFESSAITASDNLNITSLMLNYYRIRERAVSGWWGLGATYVGNEVQETGFAYQVGLEVYPFQPISLSTTYKQSFINERSINEFKVLAKYHRKKMTYYTGYNDYSLGGVSVSGFVLGTEVRF